MPPAHDSQLLKGVLAIILLRLLAEGESYGFELVSRVRELGLVDLPDGSVYTALARLEREKAVISWFTASSSGPPRKYYRLSRSGYALLAEGERAWTSLVQMLEPLFARPVPPAPKEASS